MENEKNKNEGSAKTTNVCMDEENKKAIKTLMTEGDDAFIKHVFNPTGEKPLTYSEMRAKFG